MSVSRGALFVGLLLAASCGGGGGGSSSAELSELEASGAVVGMQGAIRMYLTNPAPSDTTVTLNVIDTGVATLPSKVSVKAGALSVTVPYVGVAEGSTSFSATLGSSTMWSSLSVVDEILVEAVDADTAEVGAPDTFSVQLNIEVPTDTDVTISVADTSIVTADAAIHVSAFDDTGTGTINYVAAGSTSITATLGMSSASTSVTAVAHANLDGVSGDASIEVGGTLNLYAQTDADVAKTTAIAVTSSTPSVLAAPTLSIAPGNSEAQTTEKAAAAGDTTLTYTLGTASFTQHIHVVTSGALSAISFSGTPAVGSPLYVSVSLDATAVAAHQVTLASSDATVVAVPSTTTIEPGTDSTVVQVTPLKVGAAVITATYQGISRQVLIQVGSTATSAPYIDFEPPPVVSVGSITQIYLYAYVPNSNDNETTAAFTSSDPTILSLPASASLDYQVYVPMTAIKAGTVTITCTVFGVTTTETVTVLPDAGISSFGGATATTVGTPVTWEIELASLPPLGTPITLTSSAPSVVTVPAVVYADGDTTIEFVLTPVATGSAIISATIGSDTISGVFHVGSDTTGTLPADPQLTSFSIDPTPMVMGAVQIAVGQFNEYLVQDTTVMITFATSGIVSTPNVSVLVPAGTQRFYVPLTATSAGSTTLTATVGTMMATTSPVTVTNTPTFSGNAPPTMKTGDSALLYVYAEDNMATSTSVTVSSSDSTIVAVPVGMGTLAPGEDQEASFVLTAKGAGTATITVTPGSGTAQMYTVVVSN